MKQVKGQVEPQLKKLIKLILFSVVIACPPIKDTGFLININSTLQMPSGTPVLKILDPNNVGLACKRILSLK